MSVSWDEAIAGLSASLDTIEASLGSGAWSSSSEDVWQPPAVPPLVGSGREDAVRALLARYRRIRDAVDEAMLDTAEQLAAGRTATTAHRGYLRAESFGEQTG